MKVSVFKIHWASYLASRNTFSNSSKRIVENKKSILPDTYLFVISDKVYRYNQVYLINCEVGDRLQVSATAAFINQLPIGVNESKVIFIIHSHLVHFVIADCMEENWEESRSNHTKYEHR